MIRMVKQIKNSKFAAIMQYMTLAILSIAILGIAVWGLKIADTTLNSFINDIGDLKVLLENSNNNGTAREKIQAFSLLVSLFLGLIGIVMLILCTIALILNLRKPSIKRWKIARVLNLICTIIIILMFGVCCAIPIINIIVVYFIIFNIYIIFFFKPVNLISLEESEDL